MSSPDISQMSMLELFRQEAETQAHILNTGLLQLEHTPGAADQLEACMRAAHSLKGAARIIGLQSGVDVAHVMEDCFVLAQQGELLLRRQHIDVLLKGVDLLLRIANPPGGDDTWAEHAGKAEIAAFVAAMEGVIDGSATEEHIIDAAALAAPVQAYPVESAAPVQSSTDGFAGARSVRVNADNLDRLLSLSGESLVASRRLKPFAESMLRLKRMQREMSLSLDALHQSMSATVTDDVTLSGLSELRSLLLQSQHMVVEQLGELDLFDRRSVNLSQRLYDEALACRMRPLSDSTGGCARMVRDVAHSLGKLVRLEINGASTQIDRDILEKLEAPIGHLLRNAVDHGIELPHERVAIGKPEQGVIHLEARHSAGMLLVNVTDDGAGVDLAQLRRTIVQRKLSNEETVAQLSDAELLEFLLLPSFSLRETVTSISGRGVGLDVVANMLKEVRGTIRISNTPGRGTRFQLQLPLTLSVIRSLLVTINQEPYAFPLSYVNRTLELRRDQLAMLEGYQHFEVDGRQVGLVSAHQLLQKGTLQGKEDVIAVVVIGDNEHTYGVAVDGFLGERMLVVQPLDKRLGKIPDVLAGALMEDGSPVLILDVADMIRSVEKLTHSGRLASVEQRDAGVVDSTRKRILVVDDSLTVRELERKLLSHRGYEVSVAVDGMDGWNAVRTEHFDLVITDIDMPRMDGIELVTLIRQASNLGSLPVMIVSYKDREEDRQRGLEAGADYYFTKSSFHDESLLQAVADLIGEA